MKHIAAHYGLDRDTLHNGYYGKTQAARAAHPEQRSLTEEQERSVEEWVEKWDALGHPPKHNELRRMIVQILNNPEGTRCDRVGDHCTSRFLKRHPSVARQIWRGCAMHRKHHHLPQGRESPKTQQRKRHLNEATQDNEERTKAMLFWQMIVRRRGRWMRLSGWGGVEESTNEEEELQNEGKTGYERFPLAETSANIRRTDRGLASVSAARGEQRVGRKGKGKGG